MDLSKNQKVLIGFVHFLPIVGIICYFVYFFTFFLGMVATAEHQQPDGNPAAFFSGFIVAFVILMITILISIGIKIFDIVHLVKSNRDNAGNKVIMWVLLIIFTSSIGELIYYFLEILPNKKQEVQEL